MDESIPIYIAAGVTILAAIGTFLISQRTSRTEKRKVDAAINVANMDAVTTAYKTLADRLEARTNKLEETIDKLSSTQDERDRANQEYTKILLEKIDGLSDEVLEQSRLIASQSELVADLRTQIVVLVDKLAVADERSSGDG